MIPDAPDRDLTRAIDAALEDLLRFDPVRASSLGYAAHDGSFADLSEGGRRARRRALGGHAHQLEGRRAQDPEVELDRRLLLDELQVQLRTEEDLMPAQRDPLRYVEEVADGLGLLLLRGPLEGQLGALLSRLRQVPALLGAARAALSPEEVPRPWAEAAVPAARAGLRLLTETIPQLVRDAVGDVPILGPLDAACGEAALHLGGYANFLEAEVLPRAAGDFAAGDAYYTFLLHRRQGVQKGPGDLLALAEREVARLREALAEAAARLRPGAPSWEAALGALDAEDPPAQDAAEAGQDLVPRLREASAALCPLAPGEELLVEETPAYARALLGGSRYVPPPLLQADGPHRGRLWLTPGAHRGRGELLLTCARQAYPGRHLLHGHLARAGSRARRILGTDPFREGWAAYAQGLLPELLPIGPAAELHLHRSALLRALGAVLDVQLHCQGLPPEEAADQLVRGAGLPRPRAEAAVRRVLRAPTRFLCGLAGHMALRRLRLEAERREGEAFRPAVFHGKVLGHGAIPLGYLHERLTPRV